MSLYKNPEYYDIAFSWRNISKEVNFFEAAIRKFSKIKVKKVLELASGNSPYLEEWDKRGYQYFGLDLSPEMLNFTRKRAEEKGTDTKLFLGNMNNFSLDKLKVDLVYVLLGSLYATSNDEFFQHLDCVSKVLKKGGLYILNDVIRFDLLNNDGQSWTISKRGIKIKVSYRAKAVNPTAQIYQEDLILKIDDHGVKKQIYSNKLCKFFFPQEFLSLIKCHRKFEFLGWFNNFDIHKPVTFNPRDRKVVVLRKN
jgi:SAM-dependent methyltransferase